MSNYSFKGQRISWSFILVPFWHQKTFFKIYFTKTIRISHIFSTEGQSQEPLYQPLIVHCFISHTSTVLRQDVFV